MGSSDESKAPRHLRATWAPASPKHVNPGVQLRDLLRRHLPGPHGVCGNAIPSALLNADASGHVIALANAVTARDLHPENGATGSVSFPG